MENPAQEPVINNNNGQQSENNLSTPPVAERKKFKLKWIGVGVLATLILVGVIAFTWSEFQKKGNDENVNKISNQPNQTQLTSPPTTTFPIDSTPWEISLAKDEVKTHSNLVENNLIYAVKSDYRSTVYKRNLQSGTQTKLLEFDESRKADKSGNFWNGLPPSIALSLDKRSLAFIDKEGLKVYDFQTKNTRTFIRKTEEGSSETDTPPKWSVSSLGGTYDLARPLWSSDGKYISFLRAHYEGSSFGVINVESGAYFALKDIPGGYHFSWSPVGHSYVVASSEEYANNMGMGLYVSSQSNIIEANNIALKFDKTEATSFFEANFSPDGKKIVFIFEEPYDYDGEYLAIVNSDGTGFTILAEKTDVRTPIFSSDGNSVFYFKKKNDKQVLVRYDLANKKSTDLIILPSEFNRWEKAYWTKDGFLALVGILSNSPNSNLTLGGDSTRMLILDIANKKVIYASPIFYQFTNFAGLSN